MSTSTTPGEEPQDSEQQAPLEVEFLPPFVKLTLLGTTDHVYIDPEALICFYPRAKAAKGTYVHVGGVETPFLVEETGAAIEEMYRPNEL